MFTPAVLCHDKAVSNCPKVLFPQERDWTCSLACVRTLLSGIVDSVPAEVDYIDRYNLQAGPHYSRDMKRLGMLDGYDAVYGCDEQERTFDRVLDYMSDGYFIMLESMYNYAHWFVLLGYYPTGGDLERSRLLVYDPYYDETRLLCVDEFLGMWIDGNFAQTGVEKDFVAVRAKV